MLILFYEPRPNVRFWVEDATALSFEDNSFDDAVIISNALHIMPDPVKVLAEMRRVLKANGLLICPHVFTRPFERFNMESER